MIQPNPKTALRSAFSAADGASVGPKATRNQVSLPKINRVRAHLTSGRPNSQPRVNSNLNRVGLANRKAVHSAENEGNNQRKALRRNEGSAAPAGGRGGTRNKPRVGSQTVLATLPAAAGSHQVVKAGRNSVRPRRPINAKPNRHRAFPDRGD